MAAFSVQDAQSQRFLLVENSPASLFSISMGGKSGGYTYYIGRPLPSAPAGRATSSPSQSPTVTALPKGEPLAWRESSRIKCKAACPGSTPSVCSLRSQPPSPRGRLQWWRQSFRQRQKASPWGSWRRRRLRGFYRPRPLSQSLAALTALPKGEPLAVHANFTSLPRPLPLGEVDANVVSRRRGRGCSPQRRASAGSWHCKCRFPPRPHP